MTTVGHLSEGLGVCIGTPRLHSNMLHWVETVQTFLFPGNREFCKYIQHPDWVSKTIFLIT